jgi:hypothetical protein
MKTNFRLIIIAAIGAMIITSQTGNAQNTSPFWSLAGNNNASTSSKLGTINAVALRLTTNNSTRLYINSSGNVGIGTGNSTNAAYRLYVTGSRSGIYGQGSGSGVQGQGGTYGVYGTGTSYGLYGISTTGYGAAGISTNNYGLYGNSVKSYGFYGHSTTGYGGIANSDSSDGFDAYSSNGYFGIYASCGNSSGYGMYGYSPDIGIYGSGGAHGTDGYSYSGQGIHGESYTGLGGFFHSSASWALEATTDSGYYAGVFFGHVYASQGFITSDRRLKKNIQDFSDAMSIINKLQPKHFEFKNDAQYAGLHLPTGTHYGLLAQDLEQVLPNLVHEEIFNVPVKTDPIVIKPRSPDGTDVNQYQKPASIEKTERIPVKAVNYEELIPVMIKAMQEQDQKIEALTEEVNKLKAAMQAEADNHADALKLTNAYVEQIIPNPASNSTTIYYNSLPNGSDARLVVYDMNGKRIKQMQLSKGGSGSIKVDISSLSAGTYTYALLIDGKLMDSKPVVVAR